MHSLFQIVFSSPIVDLVANFPSKLANASSLVTCMALYTIKKLGGKYIRLFAMIEFENGTKIHEVPPEVCTANEWESKLFKSTDTCAEESAQIPETRKDQQRRALMPFVIISISYLLYTTTDGSVRMIVLLHAYNKAFSAMEARS